MSLALGRPLETQLYAVINHHPPHFYKVIKCHFESILHFQARPCQDPCIYGSYILQGFSHPKVESPNFKLPTAETKSLGINAQLPTDQHLDLLKMICDVPMCKSTIRGIYREYVVLKNGGSFSGNHVPNLVVAYYLHAPLLWMARCRQMPMDKS